MGATVETVTGPVPTTGLGRVLMHEHLVVLDDERARNYPQLGQHWDEEEVVAHVVRELERARDAGFDTLVDVTVVPMGRDLGRVREVSGRAGINIIVATGFYVFDVLPMPYASLQPSDGVDPLAELFVDDVVRGAGDGIRAGVIKCAVDRQGLTPDVSRVLRASAVAHRRTGVPITTHTNASARSGLDQQRVLAEEGVDLTRVIIGHCDDSTDLDYLERLLDRGSYLGMDRLGIVAPGPSLGERVATVAALCERGYADRIVLSHDVAAFHNWGPPGAPAMTAPAFTRISDEVLPELLRRGVGDAQIQQMLVANPRTIFENNAPY